MELNWSLKTDYPEKNGFKVLSTFSSGGGSTMGYKLAGFDVIGCVEIDPKVYYDYVLNHRPKHGFNLNIKDFNKLAKEKKVPAEFYGIDILDGSPPCSVFSSSGSRHKKWGKKSYFREGQAAQYLDDLFFDYLNTVEILKPKIAIAENVTGIAQGKAKYFCTLIVKRFRELGYKVQTHQLNAAEHGVPQARERIFFIATRNDFNFSPKKKKPIPTKEALKNVKPSEINCISNKIEQNWDFFGPGDLLSKALKRTDRGFNVFKLHPNKPSRTILASQKGSVLHWNEKRSIAENELKLLGTFPNDFKACKNSIWYYVGMSVPPFLMREIALEAQKYLAAHRSGDGREKT